jgi:hypothetical protein
VKSALNALLQRLDGDALLSTRVIPWSSPIPSFGDLSRSTLATLGLNPSNREFVDVEGNELAGAQRRFHTLGSLGLTRWSDATARERSLILESCRAYFTRNPYDGWFRRLDFLISGTRASYYDAAASACHLDLIPYATACKWTELQRQQRASLLRVAGDTLALLLRDSPVRVLVLNGASVISNFEATSGVRLEQRTMAGWTLPRRTQPGVMGVAFKGSVRRLGDIELGREVLVLGFNHNIQSSFGVTTDVMESIRSWIARSARAALS